MNRTLKRVLIGFCVFESFGLMWWARIAIKKRNDKLRLVSRNHPIPHRKEVSLDPDDKIPLRSERPASLADEKSLKGRTLWVSAGGQMDYYPWNGRSADFMHPVGVLLGAQRLHVTDAVEQVVPITATTQIPRGDAQVLLIFTLPDAATHQYAVAVGNREGRDYDLLTDQLFFYDDPHTLYGYWGPTVWAAIDQHKAIQGMTERQVQMALGQLSTPRGDIMGDRNLEFDNRGKATLVRFVNGKATVIRDISR